MHELALISELIVQVGHDAAERGITKINAVTLAVGKLSHVQPSSLRFGFDLAKEGTMFHNAVLVICQEDGDILEIVEYEGEQCGE
ncbi:MAG: hydrogenase nickel incorporation protein HypA [Firmicutes bacterium]|nr:hydrogenase nickel incorporation protein HypA [Bacillota bacterium]